MLVSLPESLRNSLSQRETGLQTLDYVVLYKLWEAVLFLHTLKDLWSTDIASDIWLHKALPFQTPLIQMKEDFYLFPKF